MHKLIAELRRLYLTNDRRYPDADLERHLRGELGMAVDLADDEGMARALVINFVKRPGDEHWSQLCATANALQTELGLPAPAVSVSGGDSYGLWLSLEKPVPAARLQQLKALLHQAYFAEQPLELDNAAVELPPCIHQPGGLWAAFINPGMGASFADELGLEMAPPLTAQVAFLEGLRGITGAELEHALELLQKPRDARENPTPAPAPAPASTAIVNTSGDGAGPLLRDASIEQIVRHLQERNIEPTLRFLK